MGAKVRWGILSTANIGRRVIPAIHASVNGEVVAVCSRSLERAQEFAHEQNIPKAYGSYEALLADENIDAIYNPLPNSLHAVNGASNAPKPVKPHFARNHLPAMPTKHRLSSTHSSCMIFFSRKPSCIAFILSMPR